MRFGKNYFRILKFEHFDKFFISPLNVSMNLEKILYAPFGNNIIIGSHIEEQLKFLEEIVPSDFKGKEMYDFGCGDGKITKRLKDIFQAKKVLGFDVNPSLVKRAKKRGIRAEVLDLERWAKEGEDQKGELAVIWGVLHHLKNPKEVLKKIKNNFQYLFLREPLLGKRKPLFELGSPFEKEKFKKDLDEILKNYKDYEYNSLWPRIVYQYTKW